MSDGTQKSHGVFIHAYIITHSCRCIDFNIGHIILFYLFVFQ